MDSGNSKMRIHFHGKANEISSLESWCFLSRNEAVEKPREKRKGAKAAEKRRDYPELRNRNRWKNGKLRSECARPRAQKLSPTKRLHHFLRLLCWVAVAEDDHTPPKSKTRFGVRD